MSHEAFSKHTPSHRERAIQLCSRIHGHRRLGSELGAQDRRDPYTSGCTWVNGVSIS
jgi:hypothetical protein